RELHIAAAFDIQGPNDAQAGRAQQLIFAVGQRLARRNDDAVAGMYADRVEVLHVTHDDTVVIRVAHNLVLDFLHARDALLDQTLADRAVANAAGDDLAQLFLIGADAA